MARTHPLQTLLNRVLCRGCSIVKHRDETHHAVMRTILDRNRGTKAAIGTFSGERREEIFASGNRLIFVHGEKRGALTYGQPEMRVVTLRFLRRTSNEIAQEAGLAQHPVWGDCGASTLGLWPAQRDKVLANSGYLVWPVLRCVGYHRTSFMAKLI